MSWRADISRNVQQFRILFDSNNRGAAGVRSFVERNYNELKRLNPETAFLIRMRPGSVTEIMAKYDLTEEVRHLEGATEADVEEAMRELVVLGGSAPRGGSNNPSVEYVIEGGQDGLESDPWADDFVEARDEKD